MLTEITVPASTFGVIYNPAAATFADPMLKAIGGIASSRKASVLAMAVDDQASTESAIEELSRKDLPGLLCLPDSFTMIHRAVIVRAAERWRVPAAYWHRKFVLDGGLMSYGVDFSDLHRRPAGYVDAVLKGVSPADLPVQNPTKFEMLVSLKLARALNAEIPPTLLAAADEVIE